MYLFKLVSVLLLLLNGKRAYGFVRFFITGDYFDRYLVSSHIRKNQMSFDKFLVDKFRYYRNLSPEGRNKFLARLSNVMDKVDFVGHDGLEVTDEMRISILFSKIQLTYGLSFFHFKRFSRFVIFPETFYSRYFERDLKGLTSGSGFMMLSWDDFQDGYLVDNDRFNLGLHEMAHAFRLELKAYRSINYKVQSLNNLMDERAVAEMDLHSRGVPTVLREYAYTNHEEFFAVCIEYFFEVPELLKSSKPEIYQLVSEMLNQDPLNIYNNYKLR